MWKRETGDRLAHSPIAVGRFLLAEAERQGFELTPLRLLKIAFLSHGWMLGLHRMPLARGPVEAWKCGPVFPALYHAIEHRGAARVRLSDLSLGDGELFDADERAVMTDSVRRYGPLTGAQLVELTHADSSPWDLTRHRAHWRNPVIPNDLIEFYYRKILEWHRRRSA